MITIPTVAQIKAQIIADIEGKIGQSVPALPKAFFRILATALAGVVSLLYRFGAWVYDQIFPQSAGEEALTRIGEQFGIIRNPAVAAVLTITATGVNDTIIPAGTLWAAGGLTFTQQAAVTVASGSATLTAICTVTGAAGNRANASTITMATPLAGADAVGTISGTVTTGVDKEDVELYRTRIMQRIQQRPQGGAIPDYITWALEVAGIVKAFAFNTNAGEVTVYPMVALTGTRIPDSTKRAEVLAYVGDPARRPLCANVLVAAMTERVITPTVTSLSPDTTALRTAIQNAWSAYLLGRYPMQYTDEINPTSVLSLAGMYAEAIGAGASSLTMTIAIDGGGTIGAYTLLNSELVKLGTVTWPT